MQNLRSVEGGTKQLADWFPPHGSKTQSGFWEELCQAKSFVVRAYYFSMP